MALVLVLTMKRRRRITLAMTLTRREYVDLPFYRGCETLI